MDPPGAPPSSFSVPFPSDAGIAAGTELRQIFDAFLADVMQLTTPQLPYNSQLGARERAIVLTKLQEAHAFALRALLACPQNQKAFAGSNSTDPA